MPHFNIEYSANLDGKVDFDALCQRILDAILATNLFEIGAVRVRAFRPPVSSLMVVRQAARLAIIADLRSHRRSTLNPSWARKKFSVLFYRSFLSTRHRRRCRSPMEPDTDWEQLSGLRISIRLHG